MDLAAKKDDERQESSNIGEDDEGGAQALSNTQKEKMKKARQKANIVVEHIDIIKDEFWLRRPWLLSGKPGKSVGG